MRPHDVCLLDWLLEVLDDGPGRHGDTRRRHRQGWIKSCDRKSDDLAGACQPPEYRGCPPRTFSHKDAGRAAGCLSIPDEENHT